MAVQTLKSYPVWDRTTRLFHWVNFLAVLVLIAVGVAILNDRALGVSNDGKILLKTVHVLAGYVFAFNLLVRFVWGFAGGHFSRWRQVLPFGPGFLADLRAYRAGEKVAWLGHNPMGRLAVLALLLTMTTMAVTGLVLAGTDLFYPPFGPWFAQWVAAPGVDPASLVPYAPDLVDADRVKEMRAFRSIFIETHETGFYVMIGLILLHIGAVVLAELRHGGTIVSAMFTGRKSFNKRPADLDKAP